MANQTIWRDFIQHLRVEQDELRRYLAPFEAGSMHVGQARADTTDQEMATVRREIASLQVTIDRVIAEQGLDDA